MNWTALYRLLLFLTALAVMACGNDNVVASAGGQSSAAASSAPPVTPLDRARAEFKPALVHVTAEPQRTGARVVYLLGENHASVRTQVQIVEIVDRLIDAKLIDAVLVEGSDGSIDFSSLASGLSRGAELAEADRKAYWRAELEWGHVAAFEYIGLTRPGFAIQGVEDMRAKARFTVLGLVPGERDIDRQRGADERSVRAFEDALRQLEGKIDADQRKRVDGLLASYRAAVARSQAAHRAYVNASKPSDERVKLEVARVDLTERWRALRPALAEARRVQDEYIQRAKAYDAKKKPYAADIVNLRGLIARAQAGDSRAEDRLGEISELARSLEPEGKAIQALAEQLEEFKREKGPELDALSKEAARISARVSVLEAPRARAAQPLGQALEARQASFFALANALRDVGEPHGLRFEKIEGFFRDEAERAEAEEKSHILDMSERDAAMVRNTANFFAGGKDRRAVALIVGSLHLEGMTKRLREAGFDVLAGKMTAADGELEPWEEEEWNKREEIYAAFFSDAKRNPETRFLNPDWVGEQAQTIQSLRALGTPGSKFVSSDDGLAGGGKIYEAEGGTRAVLVTGQTRNPQARPGNHVIRGGPVPGQPGQRYELYDRKAARADVKRLSGQGTVFSYYHKVNQEGRRGYVIHTPDGEMTLEQFENAPPRAGGRPKRVVMFGEPDEIMRGSVAVSPLWERLRGGAGGGNGGPPKPPRWSAPWDDGPSGPPRGPRGGGPAGPRRGGPAVLLTLNPTRAKRNVEILDKQRARGPIAFVDHAGLDQLHFTSPDGEHAQVVVIVAKNTDEFRQSVRRAAEARKLEGKQIALVTCGDAFADTAMLKEMLLDNGAVMVWVPDRQVTPEAGQRLVSWMQRTTGEGQPNDVRGDISEVVYDALGAWQREAPSDPDLAAFRLSRPWVILAPPGGTGLMPSPLPPERTPPV